MSPIETQIARLNDLKTKWNAYRIPPISVWPAILIDADDGMMAAVEHYFLCRCWVGNGIYPAWEVTAMDAIYDWGKIAGVAPRHNPNKPTTPPSALQMAAKLAGVRDGKADLEKSGKSAPWITSPPKYY